MKHRFVVSAMLGLILAAGTIFASPGNARALVISTDTPVNITCTSTGQLCDQSYKTSATTGGRLSLGFQSLFTSCASFSVTFAVDGAVVFTSPVLAPFASTGTFEAGPVSPGVHALEVRATGTVGGCDTGTLTAWAGIFSVTTDDTVPPPPPPPDPDPDPDPAPPPPPPPSGDPTNPNQCKFGGWAKFMQQSPEGRFSRFPLARRFKNQGDCVSWCERWGKHWPESDKAKDRRDEAERRGSSGSPFGRFRE